MVILKIDELESGMILAESVYNRSGSLLLEKNTSLTKRRIWMLKTWGIDKVSLEGKSKEGDNTVSETELETKETIEKELRAKFEGTIDDPVMEIIMKAASRQLQKSLSDKDAQDQPA